MNLAAGFAKAGRKTLVIDFDCQANLSRIMLGTEPSGKTITDVMAGTASISECIIPTKTPNLDLVASNLDLETIEKSMLLQTSGIQQFRLKRALKEVKDYDEIVIDNRPSLNMCSTNALCACDQLIIPAIPDLGSEEGIRKTLAHASEILEQIEGVDFDYMILITMVHRSNTDKEVISRVTETYGTNHIFNSRIRYQAKPIKDAGYDDGVLIDNPKANVAGDYNAFIAEVLER